MKQKYPKIKLPFFEIVKSPFVFISDTFKLLRIRNKKRLLIRKKILSSDISEFKNEKDEINNLSYALSQTLGIIYFTLRFVFWPIVLYLIIYLCVTFVGRVSDTEINADLYVSNVVVDSLIKSPNRSLIRFNAPDSIEVLNSNYPESPLTAKFSNNLNTDIFREAIGFEMPTSALVSIQSPDDTNQTIIRVSPHNDINFSYNIYSDYISPLSDSNKRRIVNDVDNKIDTIHRTSELIITLFGNAEYDLKPIVANQVYFNKEESNGMEYYILHGTIHLLDTKGDSISLYRDNYLSIQPIGKVKLYISRVKEGFRIRFTTKVSRLETGAEFGSDIKNSMPLKMQTNYDKYPYLWLTIPVLLPIFFSLFSSKSNYENTSS